MNLLIGALILEHFPYYCEPSGLRGVWLFFHPSDEDLSLGTPDLTEKPRRHLRFGLHLYGNCSSIRTQSYSCGGLVRSGVASRLRRVDQEIHFKSRITPIEAGLEWAETSRRAWISARCSA